jgi:hypothetical protein
MGGTGDGEQLGKTLHDGKDDYFEDRHSLIVKLRDVYSMN